MPLVEIVAELFYKHLEPYPALFNYRLMKRKARDTCRRKKLLKTVFPVDDSHVVCCHVISVQRCNGHPVCLWVFVPGDRLGITSSKLIPVTACELVEHSVPLGVARNFSECWIVSAWE